MNYKKIYKDFIKDRKAKEPLVYKGLSFNQRRTLNKTHSGEYENHHIVAKWQGGIDSAENMVTLTPSDHLFAHMLLAKTKEFKHIFALMRMLNQNSSNQKRIVVGKRYRLAYALSRAKQGKVVKRLFKNKDFRKKHAKATSIATKKAFQNPETRKKHLVALAKIRNTQEWHDTLSKAQKIAQNTPQAKKKRSEITKKLWKNKEYRASVMKNIMLNMVTKRKKIINLDTKKIFASTVLAGESISVSRKAITNAIKRNGTSGGYRWAYA